MFHSNVRLKIWIANTQTLNRKVLDCCISGIPDVIVIPVPKHDSCIFFAGTLPEDRCSAAKKYEYQAHDFEPILNN